MAGKSLICLPKCFRSYGERFCPPTMSLLWPDTRVCATVQQSVIFHALFQSFVLPGHTFDTRKEKKVPHKLQQLDRYRKQNVHENGNGSKKGRRRKKDSPHPSHAPSPGTVVKWSVGNYIPISPRRGGEHEATTSCCPFHDGIAVGRWATSSNMARRTAGTDGLYQHHGTHSTVPRRNMRTITFN